MKSSFIWNRIKRIKTGKELWLCLLYENIEKSYTFFQRMYFIDSNGYFHHHRIYKSIENISFNGKFPDDSYYRLTPESKRNFRNVLTHTYEVQDFLFTYQHPINCDNEKYLIIRGYGSGHGSEIHVITSYLALAISLNRIAILDPYYRIMKGYGQFCRKYKNWLCFLEQLTNCSLFKEDYINAIKFYSKNQTEKVLYIGGTLKYRNTIPNQIYEIIKFSPITRNSIIHYWRIQASTYIVRLNKQTNEEVNNRIHNSLQYNLNDGCFNIWVRHGDKYKEMQLLNVEDYIPAYELYSKIVKKRFPIYLSTDDPNVTNYFDNYHKGKAYYLNFSRNNGNLSSNMKRGAEMTLNFLTDIKAALHCEVFSGTRSSNVVRLIDELRSTVGFSANSFYFENGRITFSNTSYEYMEYW